MDVLAIRQTCDEILNEHPEHFMTEKRTIDLVGIMLWFIHKSQNERDEFMKLFGLLDSGLKSVGK
jgi:hypothetical protein